jgi:hypothetical protein
MNRRELLRDVGVATAVASLASSASQAQAPVAGVNMLIAYYSVTLGGRLVRYRARSE